MITMTVRIRGGRIVSEERPPALMKLIMLYGLPAEQSTVPGMASRDVRMRMRREDDGKEMAHDG